MDTRREALASWLSEVLETSNLDMQIASGDASFRRYFRITLLDESQQTWIAMDAPPEHEDCVPFVEIAKAWRAAGINTPEIYAQDLDQGFLLLSDFGDQVLLPLLSANAPDKTQGDRYYREAINVLLNIQQISTSSLPPYDSELLQREMALFPDWLLAKKLEMPLSSEEQGMLADVFGQFEQSALNQPQVTVHRDYHSRNLMVTDEGLGIIDFQDAVAGPATYDLVSLLKDCYIVWPKDAVDEWCQYYWDLASAKGLLEQSYADFKQAFDLMGMQRHLKAAGIFARLSLRDGKHGYLNDIPRTVDYIVNTAAQYPQFAEFSSWLKQKVQPLLLDLKP